MITGNNNYKELKGPHNNFKSVWKFLLLVQSAEALFKNKNT